MAGAALACGGREDPPAEPRVPVQVAEVVRDSLVDWREAVGRLVPTPGGEAALTAPAAGVIARVWVELGEEVARGARLVDLDVPELASRARELSVASDVASREAARQQSLLAQGITSRKQADQAQADADAAQASAQAAAELLARTRVTSPLEGAVQRVAVREGERVDVGALLVEVVDADTVDLLAMVPAGDLGHLRPRQVALVSGEGAPGSLPGWVQGITPGVDSFTNAGQVVIRIPNLGEILRPGTGAVGRVAVGVRRGVLLVPDAALVLIGDRQSVFVVQGDSSVHATSVAVGIRSGGRTEVTGDLQPGDRVVTVGAFGLQDGMRVVPAASEAPAAP